MCYIVSELQEEGILLAPAVPHHLLSPQRVKISVKRRSNAPYTLCEDHGEKGMPVFQQWVRDAAWIKVISMRALA